MYTSYSTVYCVYIIQYSVLCIHHIVQCIMYTSYSTVYYVYIIQYSVLCIHHTVQCIVYTSYSTVYYVYIIQYSVLCIHHTVQCIMYTSYSTVYYVYRNSGKFRRQNIFASPPKDEILKHEIFSYNEKLDIRTYVYRNDEN